MSLSTYSVFYYGHTVDLSNNQIDFDEGAGELTAVLRVGEYTLTEYAAELERALNAASVTLTFTVTVNRTTRVLTIAADGNFTLKVATGSHLGTTAFTMAGFTGADRSGADTYDGDSGSGSAFEPQWYLQEYVASEDFEEAVDESVSESASGVIQVATFGTRNFIQMNIRLQTNKNPTGNSKIKVQASGIANLRAFMRYATTKAPVEFMPDIATPGAYQKVQLESTPQSKNGTGFKLNERKDMRAPGYYDTGRLLFRVVTG